MSFGNPQVVQSSGSSVAPTIPGAPPPTPANQGAARAYRNAAFTLVSSSDSVLPVDTVSFDSGSNVNLAGNRYVCPITGFYHVDVQVSVSSGAAGQTITAEVWKNGAIWSSGSQVVASAGSQGLQATCSDIVQCNAGDYLQPGYWCSAALGLNVASFNKNYFCVACLRS